MSVVDVVAVVYQIQLIISDLVHIMVFWLFYKRFKAFHETIKSVEMIFNRNDDISITFSQLELRDTFVNISSQKTNVPSCCNDFLSSTENKFYPVKFWCKYVPLAEIEEDNELYICKKFDDTIKCYSCNFDVHQSPRS